MAEALKAPPPNSMAERAVVLQHVRRDWSNTLGNAACEDAVSEAYRALLERAQKGKNPDNRVGWLCTAAWRAANDDYKSAQRHQSINGEVDLGRIASHEALPEQQIDLAETDARLRMALGKLPDDLRLAYATKHTPGLTVEAACRRLGCPRSTLMHRRARALEELHAVARGTSERFEKVFLAMATAVLAGAASRDDRRRLRELVSRSPYYAARYAELKRIDGRVGLLIPPLALDPGLADRASALLGKLRDAAHHILARGPETTDAINSSTLADGGAKAGGAVGGLGGAIGLGGAAKLAVTCGGAAAAAACVAAIGPGATFPGLSEREPDGHADAARQVHTEDVTATPTPAPDVYPAQVNDDVPQSVVAEATPASGQSVAAGQGAASTASEPAPAEDSSNSNFSFGAKADAATPPAPSGSSASLSAGDAVESQSAGGGAGAAQGGDFAFGSP